MIRVICLLYVLLVLLVQVVRAESEVKVTGDAQAYATASSGGTNGWNAANGKKQTSDGALWQRSRVRADVSVNDNLKFRLAVKTNAGTALTH